MDKKPSVCTDSFLKFTRDAMEQHNIARSREKDADDETQDILHYIEFHEVPPTEVIIKIYKRLKTARMDRRESKNTAEILEPATEWGNVHGGTIKGLEQLLGTMRKTEKAIENRRYADRTTVMEEILGMQDSHGADA